MTPTPSRPRSRSAGSRPAVADRLPHHDRLRRADQGRHREGAWLAARRRRDQGRAREARLDAPAFEIPADVLAAWRAAGERGRAAAPADWEQRLRALAAEARRVRAPHRAATCRAEALAAAVRGDQGEARGRAEGDRHPHRLGIGARSAHRRAAGDDRRLGRPHRLQQHPAEGMKALSAADYRRPLHPLRRARARHGGGHERHGAAWRNHSLFGHLPGVLRLLPAGHPARRADGPAGDPCDDPRLDRPRRGRADAPAGRASGSAAGDPQSAGVSALRCGRDGRVLAARARSAHTAERAGADAAEPAAAAHRCTAKTVAPPAPTSSLPAEGKAQVSLFATGSEVAIAVDAQKLLAARGIAARVVSVPCFELFLRRPGGRAAAGHRHRAGPDRRRGADPAGLGRVIGSDGAFRRHERLRRQRPLKDLYRPLRHYPREVAEACAPS